MFENNNNIISFFAGMLVVAGLATVDSDGNIFSKKEADLHSQCNKDVVIKCDKEHLHIDSNSGNSVATSKPSNSDSSSDDNSNTVNNSDSTTDSNSNTVNNSDSTTDSNSSFTPILVNGVYKMDSGVTDDKIAEIEKQLNKLPSVLVDKFYNSNFRINLYSSNSDLEENSHLSTSSKVLKITHRGVSLNKLFTEFAYYLDYSCGVSKDPKFVDVFNTEGVDINKTPKGYLIKSFQDYVLRGDKLDATRPLTYKYFNDYFIVMGGGVVESEEKPVEPSAPIVEEIPVVEDNSQIAEETVVSTEVVN